MNDSDTSGAVSLEAMFVPEILRQLREGGEPLVNYDTAHLCLIATGRPLSLATVKDLAVDVRTLGGRSVAPLRAFFEEADLYIKRRLARPNMKAKAAAKARAARRRDGAEAA